MPEPASPSPSPSIPPSPSQSGMADFSLDAKPMEVKAASKIQALARGQIVRNHQKDQRLWEAWNELDWKEEAELMASHSAYEDMLATMKKKKAAESKLNPDSSTSSPSPLNVTSTTTSPSPSTTPVSSDASVTSSASSSPSGPPKTYLIRTKTVCKPKSATETVDEKKVADDGLTLTDPIQLDFVTAMLDHFKFNNRLDLENVVEILRRVKAVLKAQPNVVPLTVTTRLTVVGDLHGQLDDLLAIFKLNGLPSPRNAYLFNGDFVDRGQFSCECVLVLFAFKLLYPKSVHLNRGNHEARDINSRDGFERECLLKYNHAVFDLFSDVFSCLPLAAILNNQIFVVHGGLSQRDFTIDQLNAVDRFHEIPPSDSLMEDCIWSDPEPNLIGCRSSPRGAGYLFGENVTHQFLQTNHLKLIIRSHECMQRGFEMHHSERVITVFSASNYCNSVNNEGSFIIFEKDLIPRIVPSDNHCATLYSDSFFAKPKERLSRYRMRHAVMENDIIAKLLQRISDNRLALTNWYRKVENVTPAGVRTITRMQWAEGLKAVLKLNIPFLDFQDYLGLPKLGVDGKKKGDIDFMAFLLRFRPVNALLANSSTGADSSDSSTTGTASRLVAENVEAILEMLNKNRYELESLFRHFDLNGDELISVSEFKEGIFSLQGSLLQVSFTETDVDELIKYIDSDGDGHISYAEFFSSFAYTDPMLNELQKKNAAARAAIKQSGSLRPPSQTPSPVITPRRLEEQKQMTE